ncbi:hypothetical protein [Longirhabdus pacifica]|uniref:hypothetical protein n=1 Tax=Longirhabdus pacifica TaxID=2305227 RepID=UPI001008E15C|nr:hypothetical protein [Longirhabdus pacifica]
MVKVKRILREVKYEHFVLSISYGHYKLSIGGTDKVILSHQRMLNDNHISYIYLFPVAKDLKLHKLKHASSFWGMLIDGKYVGIYFTHDILHMMSALLEKKGLKNIFLHHTLGVDMHQLEHVIKLTNAPITLYLHDFYTICTQINLMKNDKTYCGEGGISKGKCSNCTYFEESKSHVKQFKIFLKNHHSRLNIVAPSHSTKQIWCSAYPAYESKVTVVKHQQCVGEYEHNRASIQPHSHINIAFVGQEAFNKGWHEWEYAITEVLKKRSNNTNLHFYHFGRRYHKKDFIPHIPVSFQKGHMNAMVKALREHHIHCAVLWSLWPETYSYTYYESTAANAFIITNPRSGNIADSVKHRGNGIILSDVNALIDLFADETKLISLINDFRQKGKKGPLQIHESKTLLQFIPKQSAVVLQKRIDNKKPTWSFITKSILQIRYHLRLKINYIRNRKYF